MKKRMILLVLFFLLFAVHSKAENASILAQPFPDFTATDTQGNVFILSEALKDHEAALINLWATWCPPCKAEMAFLNEAYHQYGDRVAFIALSAEEDDTFEKIEAYRQACQLDFPMGRDEGRSLYQYTGKNGFPTTVIVDRFGNTSFLKSGYFFNLGEVTRTLDFFLRETYTETVALSDIPNAAATRAFPVAAATAMHVENENVKPILFETEDSQETQWAFVVYDDTARLRIDVAASDNPALMSCFNSDLYAFAELSTLLDPERAAYFYDAPMPGAEAEQHFVSVSLVSGNSGNPEIIDAAYLIAGDEYVEELADFLRAAGYPVTWKYAEPDPLPDTVLQAYILHIIDQNGAPVPGVIVNFCTDTACTAQKSDESGTIAFAGEPDIYHVQLLKAPSGFSFDSDFDMYTGKTYGEWVLRIRKD